MHVTRPTAHNLNECHSVTVVVPVEESATRRLMGYAPPVRLSDVGWTRPLSYSDGK